MAPKLTPAQHAESAVYALAEIATGVHRDWIIGRRGAQWRALIRNVLDELDRIDAFAGELRYDALPRV